MVGVVLDDLAQPTWYYSESHAGTIDRALRLLPTLSNQLTEPLPDSFHCLVAEIRSKTPENLKQAWHRFEADLA